MGWGRCCFVSPVDTSLAAVAVPSFHRSLTHLSFPSLSSFRRDHHLHLHRVPFRPHAMRKHTSQKVYKGEEQMLYVEMDSSGEDSWKLEPAVKLVESGPVGVIPTDTMYVVHSPVLCCFFPIGGMLDSACA